MSEPSRTTPYSIVTPSGNMVPTQGWSPALPTTSTTQIGGAFRFVGVGATIQTVLVPALPAQSALCAQGCPAPCGPLGSLNVLTQGSARLATSGTQSLSPASCWTSARQAARSDGSALTPDRSSVAWQVVPASAW